MSTLLFNCQVLLAQMQRFDGLRDRFSGPRAKFNVEDALTALGAIIGVAVVLFVISRWHSRYSGRRTYNSASGMFKELCNAHQLDRPARKLLKRVARWQRLSQPGRLFLEPERFEPVNLSPDLQRYSAELFELRSRLFTFEVATESRDSLMFSPLGLVEPASANSQDSLQEKLDAMESSTDSTPRTEAVGAAAFASTILQSSEEPSQPG